MAKKKYAKKNTKKYTKTYRKNYKKVDANKLDNRLSIARQVDNQIADKQLVKMAYADSRRLTAAAAAVGYYQYNLNSIYDPDRTGLGHQPLSHDQWATFYNKYRVYKVDYEIAFVALTASNVPMAVWLEASNDTTPPTTLTGWLEQSAVSNFKVLNSNTPSCRFTGTINLPALLGYTNMQYKTEEENAGVMTASPFNLAILNVIAASMDQTANPDVMYTMKLTYHCELFDRFDLGAS